MNLILRTLIILVAALVVSGATYAANQAGVFQGIASGRDGHGDFEMRGMPPAEAGTTAQDASRPTRPGRGFGEGREHGMGRGEGEQAGFSIFGIQELIKSLGIVAVIVLAYVIMQRLWSAIRGPRDRRKLQESR